MKKRILSVLTMLLLSAVVTSTAVTSEEATNPEQASYVIVTLDDEVESPQNRAEKFARSCDCSIEHVYEHTLNGFALRAPNRSIMTLLQNDGEVSGVYMDRRMELVGSDSSSTSEDPAGTDDDSGNESQKEQTIPTSIQRIGADEVRPSYGEGVNVAIIDTGIDQDHPDLESNLKGGRSFATDDPSEWGDHYGHGTHVAGTVAAASNEQGVVGVAPEVNLYSARVLSRGEGGMKEIIAGVDWVGGPDSPDIDVANMSLGGPDTMNEQPLKKAIRGAVENGVTIVAAAGNDSEDTSSFIPAKFDEVITVAAMADSDGKAGGKGPDIKIDSHPLLPPKTISDDSFAPFSNHGDSVDLIAPGVQVRSTWKGGKYRKLKGTSMASPMVAGVAALLKGKNPGLSPDQVEDFLVERAEAAPGCGNRKGSSARSNEGASNQNDQRISCGWEGYPSDQTNKNIPLVRADRLTAESVSLQERESSFDDTIQEAIDRALEAGDRATVAIENADEALSMSDEAMDQAQNAEDTAMEVVDMAQDKQSEDAERSDRYKDIEYRADEIAGRAADIQSRTAEVRAKAEDVMARSEELREQSQHLLDQARELRETHQEGTDLEDPKKRAESLLDRANGVWDEVNNTVDRSESIRGEASLMNHKAYDESAAAQRILDSFIAVGL